MFKFLSHLLSCPTIPNQVPGVCSFIFKMWKSQVGHDVKVEATANDDDDWETDPDFVVCWGRVAHAAHMVERGL